MEKAESLEQAAKTFIEANRPEPLKCIDCGKPQTTGPAPSGAIWLDRCPAHLPGDHGHTYRITVGGEDCELKRLVKFAAERERQVWAEAAKILKGALEKWPDELSRGLKTEPENYRALGHATVQTVLEKLAREFVSARWEQVK